MIKRGDRVKLTARAAAVFNNNKRPSMFDWTARRGVVERITTNKAKRSCCGMVGCRWRPCRSAALNSNQQSWDNKPTLASGRDVRFPGSSVRVEFSIRCEMNQFWPEPSLLRRRCLWIRLKIPGN